MPQIQSIAFVVNSTKPGAEPLARKLSAYCTAQGVQVKVTSEYPLPENFLQGQDACCVLGGDGTLLATVPQAIAFEVPVFGINQGKLGFLAMLEAREAPDYFPALLNGEFHLEQRSVLVCTTAEGQQGLALNDIVIKHATPSVLVGMKVYCDGELVTDYYSDGIIFSTPTGSTAYNLSAGGPIIHPCANVIAMTPICPHTLTNRSVIFSHTVKLTVECLHPGSSPAINLDGRLILPGENAYPLQITISDQQLNLLQPPRSSHFRILRSKLRWGGDDSAD